MCVLRKHLQYHKLIVLHFFKNMVSYFKSQIVLHFATPTKVDTVHVPLRVLYFYFILEVLLFQICVDTLIFILQEN